MNAIDRTSAPTPDGAAPVALSLTPAAVPEIAQLAQQLRAALQVGRSSMVPESPLHGYTKDLTAPAGAPLPANPAAAVASNFPRTLSSAPLEPGDGAARPAPAHATALSAIPPRPLPDPEAVESESAMAPESLGSAVLQSWLNQAAPASVVGPVPATPPAAAPRLETLVAETVSRVLVSDPLHDGNREVRIELAREILPATEIRLWRQEGRLHVEFIAPPDIASGTLKDALPRLGESIQSRRPEPELPVVTVRSADSSGRQHPGDGRSRQRYQWDPEALDPA